MKLTSLFVAVLFLAGCATTKLKTTSQKRKDSLIKCVTGFLHEDVSPTTSMNICGKIYEKRGD